MPKNTIKQIDVQFTDEQQKFFESKGRNVNHMIMLLAHSMFQQYENFRPTSYTCKPNGKTFKLKVNVRCNLKAVGKPKGSYGG